MSAHWQFLPRAESWGRAEGDKIVQLGFGGSAMVLRRCGLNRTKLTRAKGPDPRASLNMLILPCWGMEILDKVAGTMHSR